MREQLQRLLEKRTRQCVSSPKESDFTCDKIEKKKETGLKRSTEIVKSKASGKILKVSENGDSTKATYQVHFQYLIKQKGQLFLEEEMELREAIFFNGTLIKDEEVHQYGQSSEEVPAFLQEHVEESRVKYKYNRLKAVQYAERWWNDYNPAFKKIEANDCTNFISQCLFAGGAPMRGYPNRGNGWWMRGNSWSWSWTIAHAFRLYLGNSKSGLRAKEVSRPDLLLLGDVICYDFEGDGRFNHNTIVTGKDYYGMPLVNAHTYNSRMRYWAYEDSTAYTPNIKYKFFTIVDDD